MATTVSTNTIIIWVLVIAFLTPIVVMLLYYILKVLLGILRAAAIVLLTILFTILELFGIDVNVD